MIPPNKEKLNTLIEKLPHLIGKIQEKAPQVKEECKNMLKLLQDQPSD